MAPAAEPPWLHLVQEILLRSHLWQPDRWPGFHLGPVADGRWADRGPEAATADVTATGT
jgi:hypothetical protein